MLHQWEIFRCCGWKSGNRPREEAHLQPWLGPSAWVTELRSCHPGGPVASQCSGGRCRASAGGVREQLPDNAVQLCAFTLGNAPEPHCSGLLSCLFLWKLLSKERGRQTNTHHAVPGAGEPAPELGFVCSRSTGAGWTGCSSHCDPSMGL